MKDRTRQRENKKNRPSTPSKPTYKIIITPEILTESMADFDLNDITRFHVNNINHDGSSYHLNKTFDEFKKDIKNCTNYISIIVKQYKTLHIDFRRSATIIIDEMDLKKFLSDDRITEIKGSGIDHLLWLTAKETTEYLKNVIHLNEVA